MPTSEERIKARALEIESLMNELEDIFIADMPPTLREAIGSWRTEHNELMKLLEEDEDDEHWGEK